jgi:hypothetical protein
LAIRSVTNAEAITKNEKEIIAEDTRFNVENLSNTKEKNHGAN